MWETIHCPVNLFVWWLFILNHYESDNESPLNRNHNRCKLKCVWVCLCTSMCEIMSSSVALKSVVIYNYTERWSWLGRNYIKLFSTSIFAASWREQQCRHNPGNRCDLLLWGNSPVIWTLIPQASVSPPCSSSSGGKVRCVTVVVVVGAHFLY